MPIRADYRDDLALTQLETALRLFFEGRDFASVVTLAGAADEIFGKLLSASGKENHFDSLKKAAAEIHQWLYGEPGNSTQIANRANRAKNTLKHWDIGQPLIVKLDLEQEAKYMLFRAVDNYWMLKGTLSAAMERFQREYMA
ncbi:MAG: hypothetical protein V4443_08260 [Pseudomonadota bacterium]